ncbi:MAG TPA: hypothetical protein DCG54_05955 [Anaerolineae bacterium]|nr:hypothetical protein [Anaerolineae bacterium]
MLIIFVLAIMFSQMVKILYLFLCLICLTCPNCNAIRTDIWGLENLDSIVYTGILAIDEFDIVDIIHRN